LGKSGERAPVVSLRVVVVVVVADDFSMNPSTRRERKSTRSILPFFCCSGGMAGQHYCLRWNNYQSNMTSVFHQLLQTEAFVDVTLACNEASLKAHKVGRCLRDGSRRERERRRSMARPRSTRRSAESNVRPRSNGSEKLLRQIQQIISSDVSRDQNQAERSY
jgi:hypothetical protein